MLAIECFWRPFNEWISEAGSGWTARDTAHGTPTAVGPKWERPSELMPALGRSRLTDRNSGADHPDVHFDARQAAIAASAPCRTAVSTSSSATDHHLS